MMKRIVLILLTFFFVSLPVWAARMDVKASIDTPLVVVGMPRMLHLEVSVPAGSRIEWPILQRQGGIAAIDMEHPEQTYMLEFGPDTRFDIDTVSVSDGNVVLAQNLQFFAFDSAAMTISPLRIVVNEADTLYSDVLALSCYQPFESIPDEPQAMQGLKDILDPPLVLWDYFRWVFYILGILAVVALVAWLVYYFMRRYKKEESGVEEKTEILEPAHVVAMNALIDLEQKHLWESGRFKEYHTELTDILRHYLERRYGVQALESTTDEIMEELVELQIHQKSSFNNLRDVLQIADLVKFAKYEPTQEENQMSYYNSRLFVEQTKEVVVNAMPGEAPASDDMDNSNKNN